MVVSMNHHHYIQKTYFTTAPPSRVLSKAIIPPFLINLRHSS